MNKYKQLNLVERERIAAYRILGKSKREIARLLNRDHSTISREICRNDKAVAGMRGYVACKAHQQSKQRKQKSGVRLRLKAQSTRDYVHEKLHLGWTPEQIAHRLSLDRPGSSICHEAIYQYIYEDYQEGIGLLPRRHPKRYLKKYSRKRQPSKIPNRISIEHRPTEINTREVFGHWESDSIESQLSLAAVNVLIERKSRLVKLQHLPQKTAENNRHAIHLSWHGLPVEARKSITYDNGSENFHHYKINIEFGTSSYFCQPYHSWEKGAVENTNSLIRRFIPKKTNLEKISQNELDRIEALLNNRPRKCLGFKTPYEVFFQLCGALAP